MCVRFVLLIFLLFFSVSEKSFAQQETNIWYFGDYAGLDFNTGVPVVLTNSSMSAFEGCASIANQDGQLLFYTDGMTVWNKNHQIMVNGTGLDGNISSTQSGVIVPQPGLGNGNLYYIFTVDATAGNFGFRYSIVDTSLQGGLGEVTVKNVPILAPTTEKITAVAKGPDKIWIITHQWNSANFYCYLLDDNGLDMTPVITNVGTAQNGTTDNCIGYLKASPDGTRLALAVDWSLQIVELYDFDKCTGKPSNPITLMTGFPGAGPYGIEFSPNSQVLYAATESIGDTSHVYQWDLQAGTPAQIISSVITMGNMTNGGALQLASNGKIYLTESGTHHMGIVNSPDVTGTGCNFVQDALNISPGHCNFGLPNFVQSFFVQTSFFSNDVCIGDTTHFYLLDNCDVDSVFWNFGDPGSLSNTDTARFPYHIYSDTGSYSVLLYTFYGGGYMDTDTVVIQIFPLPVTDIGSNTTICPGTILTLNAANPSASSYIWQDGSTDSLFNASLAGIYSVEVKSIHGCTFRDTMKLALFTLPPVSLGNDTILCEGSPMILDVTNMGVLYSWEDGSTTGTYSVISAGVYWVQVTDTNTCANSDTINVNFLPLPPLDLGNDTLICLGDTLQLNAATPGVTYHWNNGSTSPVMNVYTTGIYWVRITDGNLCSNADSFNLGVLPPPPVNMGDEIHFCFGQEAVLNATTPGGVSFLWWDGTSDATHYVGMPGIFWVTVTNIIGCNGYDTVEVFEQPLPIVQLGADTILCDGAPLLLDVQNPQNYHEWQDGSNMMTYNVTLGGTYTVMVIDQYGCSSSDQIVITSQQTPMVNLGNDSLYCYGDIIHLDAFFRDATYFWQNGSTDTTFDVSMVPGIYNVHVADQCGTAADTVKIDFHNCQSCVNIPNAFTPNQDGLNDVFLPYYDCNVTQYKFLVFNRWGQLIYTSSDIDQGWNGRSHGKSVEMGTYAWYLDYQNADKPETLYHLQGYVVLTR